MAHCRIGTLEVGDDVLMLNGKSLLGANLKEAVELLELAEISGDKLELVVVKQVSFHLTYMFLCIVAVANWPFRPQFFPS